ncbi:hypothetical protein [Noviherbaspirillum pedocola]|uniref:Uncharacterized protein n=1 Tax=Noviherbaspirillum pedocola TaxID=2801341 RepID=A0A934SRR4_9BURK|nr:hypothetical protein [Noviherbaspirillum pedocola]MBK4734285.1 hypothetical protein [Noviherbaspirillum pedocola]
MASIVVLEQGSVYERRHAGHGTDDDKGSRFEAAAVDGNRADPREA